MPLRRPILFCGQSPERRWLPLEAGVELLRAWVLVRLRPFRSYAGRLGVADKGTVMVAMWTRTGLS